MLGPRRQSLLSSWAQAVEGHVDAEDGPGTSGTIHSGPAGCQERNSRSPIIRRQLALPRADVRAVTDGHKVERATVWKFL